MVKVGGWGLSFYEGKGRVEYRKMEEIETEQKEKEEKYKHSIS